MMRLNLYFIISMISCSCLAQDYDGLISMAGESYAKQRFDSCSFFFDQAFLLKDPSGNDLYNAAVCQIKNGDKKKALLLLKSSLTKGVNISKLKIDPDLEPLYKFKDWKKLLKKANKIQTDSFNSYLFPQYARELARMWETDQYYRFRVGQAYESKADTSIINDLWKKMRRADSVNDNIAKLETIIKKIGWPTISKVGKQGASTAFLVADHSPRETMEKFFPYLEEAAKKGEASMKSYATMKDRILVNRGKKQVYGTQSYWDTNGKTILFPVEDEKNLNKRRKEVGLPPLPEFEDR